MDATCEHTNTAVKLFKILETLECDLFVMTSKYYTFRTNNNQECVPEVDITKFYTIFSPILKTLVIEEYEPTTGKKVRNLAAADNAIIARAAFEKACEYLPNANIIYRHKARVIAEQH